MELHSCSPFGQSDGLLGSTAAATCRLLTRSRGKKKMQKNPESFAGPQSGAEPPRLTAAGIYFPRKWERNAPGTFEEDGSCEGEIRSLEDINDLRVQT